MVVIKSWKGFRSIAMLILTLAVFSVPVLRCARKSPPNILWITMDSLRADHLGCTGHRVAKTPNIDRLAREGALFTQCVAQSNYTNISVPSMITGQYPTLVHVSTPLSDLGAPSTTLAEILSDRGYATSAILPDWPTGMNQGFQRVETLTSSTDLRTEACLDILETQDDRPFFIWLYYWDPHAPYQPPEEFAGGQAMDYELPSGVEEGKLSPEEKTRWQQVVHSREGVRETIEMIRINKGKKSPPPGYSDRLIAAYDGEIAFVDSKIKEVVDRIKEMGQWDNTMVILNADHGEAFGEHGYYFHGYSLYDEEIRVPLIIKPPHSLSQSKVVDGPVRNLDIMPTVLDYCHAKSPRAMEGRSLREFIAGHAPANLPACMESNTPAKKVHLVGIRQGGYKLIYRHWSGPELYDLRADPGELVNLLATAGPGGADVPLSAERKERELREMLLQIYGAEDVSDLMYTYFREKIDPQNKERLRALGYVY